MKINFKTVIILHLLLLIYSLSGILSKLAARQSFLSLSFFVLYAGVIMILFLYAIGWQQILKKMPLSTAYANKGILLIWGMIWGTIVFDETITFKMILGGGLVVLGIWLVIKNE